MNKQKWPYHYWWSDLNSLTWRKGEQVQPSDTMDVCFKTFDTDGWVREGNEFMNVTLFTIQGQFNQHQ